MPSSATITTFYVFEENKKARSSQMNSNLSTWRGHNIPVDPNTTTAAPNVTYDLGVDDHRWRSVFCRDVDLQTSTSTASLVLKGDTANTTGAFLFQIEGVTKAAITTDGFSSAYIQNSAFVPIGSIFAYCANTAPTGYLKCDGSSISRTTYAALFAVIGTSHGTNTTTSFNLPDYRGRFLRGVADGQSTDPDRASRTAMATGGNTGDTIGSIQGDTLGSHSHTIQGEISGANYSSTPPGGGGAPTGVITTDSFGGNETRPKNAYVWYIIKN